jgi:hypothetical protein
MMQVPYFCKLDIVKGGGPSPTIINISSLSVWSGVQNYISVSSTARPNPITDQLCQLIIVTITHVLSEISLPKPLPEKI